MGQMNQHLEVSPLDEANLAWQAQMEALVLQMSQARWNESTYSPFFPALSCRRLRSFLKKN